MTCSLGDGDSRCVCCVTAAGVVLLVDFKAGLTRGLVSNSYAPSGIEVLLLGVVAYMPNLSCLHAGMTGLGTAWGPVSWQPPFIVTVVLCGGVLFV